MILGGVSSFAQAFTGFVVDPQQNPIPSVAVTVKASDGRQYSGYTDNNGLFAIEGCPLGDVVITLKKDSYESGYVKSTYKANDFSLLYITMKKSNQYSSSNNSSSDGSVVGAVIAGAAGAAIIGGVASAIKKSSSSSSSSSNTSAKTSGPVKGTRNYKNVEIIKVDQKSGNVFGAPHAWIKIRNKNSYSVVARVQCRFWSEWPSNGEYTKEITIPASAIREVEIMGPQGRYDFEDVRIVTVY